MGVRLLIFFREFLFIGLKFITYLRVPRELVCFFDDGVHDPVAGCGDPSLLISFLSVSSPSIPSFLGDGFFSPSAVAGMDRQ